VLRLLEQNAPLVQRTNGVVVPPAGSASGAGCPVRGALRGALSGASRTARERPSRRPILRGSHRPALAPWPSGVTPLGRRREAPSV